MLARSRAVAEALLAHEAVGQLLRFAVAGAGLTLFAAGAYLLVAVRLHVAPLLANAVSTGCAVGLGYVVHSRWSFRAGDGDHAAQVVRFLLVAGMGFTLNSFWVWLAVHALKLPAWTPVTGMVFATPLATFAAQRYWVFAS